MTLELYTDAVLTRDVPAFGLKRFDIVKLVDRHEGIDATIGYTIEAFNVLGESIAVTVVPESALEPLREDEIPCARVFAA